MKRTQVESAGRFHTSTVRGNPHTQANPLRKPSQQPRPRPRPTVRVEVGTPGSIEQDLAEIAIYLREQNGGQLPPAVLLVEVA